ncbi:hypothetical protein EV360DRAFT_69401 [Lentinula raphanica]|nr:hypothetical protein EV360DRAFT_69401 [Lentinula raphanica]
MCLSRFPSRAESGNEIGKKRTATYQAMLDNVVWYFVLWGHIHLDHGKERDRGMSRHRTIDDSNSTSTQKDSVLFEWWDIDALTSSSLSKMTSSRCKAYLYLSYLNSRAPLFRLTTFESGVDAQTNDKPTKGEFMYRNSILTSKNWTDLPGTGRGTSIGIPAYSKELKITISSSRSLLRWLSAGGATISPIQVPAQCCLHSGEMIRTYCLLKKLERQFAEFLPWNHSDFLQNILEKSGINDDEQREFGKAMQ